MSCSLFEIGLWNSVFSEEQIKEINKTVLNVAEPIDEFGGLTHAASNARKTSIVTRFQMETLRNEIYKKIRNHSDFLDLVKLRNKISWGLTAIIIFCYFTFITIIAFAPDIFSQKIFFLFR